MLGMSVIPLSWFFRYGNKYFIVMEQNVELSVKSELTQVLKTVQLPEYNTLPWLIYPAEKSSWAFQGSENVPLLIFILQQQVSEACPMFPRAPWKTP